VTHSHLSHNIEVTAVKHPNQYFDQSVALMKPKDDKMEEE
jgi:hypothetical protein